MLVTFETIVSQFEKKNYFFKSSDITACNSVYKKINVYIHYFIRLIICEPLKNTRT